jgi:hypothetical protein
MASAFSPRPNSMDWGAKGMLMPQGVASRTRFA